jgi:hypothetical protein
MKEEKLWRLWLGEPIKPPKDDKTFYFYGTAEDFIGNHPAIYTRLFRWRQ